MCGASLCALKLACVTGLTLVLHLPTAINGATPDATWKASGKDGVVAGGGSEAVAAGIRVLAADGNAADAAVATLLALAVTDYGQYAMSGEAAVLVYDAKSRQTKSLCGLGRAPIDPAAIQWLYEHGIPSDGDIKSATVPAIVDLCVTMLREFGTKSFEEVVQPTVEILHKHDEAWSPRLENTLRRLIAAEKSRSGTRLEKLAAVRDLFYKGDIADELDAWYREQGGFLRKQDLENHVTLVEEPVSVTYREYTVYKCGPWTQGPALCEALQILEGFDLKRMGHLSPDHIQASIEALKLALADRDAYYGDPLFQRVPIDALLSKEYAQLRRTLVDLRQASNHIRPGDPIHVRPLLSSQESDVEPSASREPVPDTTNCLVADRWGNVVAATPSCNLMTRNHGPVGINHGNRLRSSNTAVGHPNCLRAGKRPRITLSPVIRRIKTRQ
jgi:gamma-glutamyltranspeptidase/glutathione hydrolase